VVINDEHKYASTLHLTTGYDDNVGLSGINDELIWRRVAMSLQDCGIPCTIAVEERVQSEP